MTTKTYSRKQLEGFTIAALKKIADLHFDPADTSGLKKAQLVDLLDGHYNPPADDEVDDEIDDVEDELDDEADDEVDDTEPAKPSTPEPVGDTLTAKQVATRIGTDAKTLRKFFRSPASTIEPVGQGGRYEFAKKDLAAIKAEFDKWNSGKAVRTKRADTEAPKPTGRMAAAEELDDDEEIDDEPTIDELEDLEDLELDEDDDLELDDDEEDD